VSEKIPSKLLMIGDGPERTAIENQCRGPMVTDHVRFLGKQEAVEEILSVSDLFILPSETESFGLAALEAMACQVPVISTNTGGIPEVNINGITGFMSNVGDIDDMAKNAVYILEDEGRLAKFKRQSFEHSKKYDIKNILPLYEDIYRRVTEKVTNGNLA
jgi:N-acetyl-alpha-D-glucosaminyl L-malate synthase BshA